MLCICATVRSTRLAYASHQEDPSILASAKEQDLSLPAVAALELILRQVGTA